MKFQDFLRLAMDATEYNSLDNYTLDCGGSVSAEDLPLLPHIYSYGREKTIRNLIAIHDTSKAAFARDYFLPLRTVENWCDGSRIIAPYTIDMLAFAVISDTAKYD